MTDDITVRLVRRVEVELRQITSDHMAVRQMAKAATVAVLRELSDEVEKAEENDNMEWPDSDDLAMLADDLEMVSTDGN